MYTALNGWRLLLCPKFRRYISGKVSKVMPRDIFAFNISCKNIEKVRKYIKHAL